MGITSKNIKIKDFGFIQKKRLRASIVKEADQKFLYVIGALEILVGNAETFLDDAETHFSEKMKKKFSAQSKDLFLKNGMRVVAIAYKKLGDKQGIEKLPNLANLTFVGALALYDPPRPETKNAIRVARQAGIKVIMATGDHPDTALAIATEVGLIGTSDHPNIMVGEEVDNLPDNIVLERAGETRVFARMTPGAKLKLEQILQRAGRIIAMTGDGVNDAAALTATDIGIAMGKGGTDVAREAADIVLTDNNFTSIVSAIEEGRTQFRNVRRTSFFLITTNIAESGTLLTFLLLRLPLPLLYIHILWLNIIGGGVTDVALATEKAHYDVLLELPRRREEPLLNRASIPFIVSITLTMVILGLVVFSLFGEGDESKARTALFVLMSLSQLSNVLTMRSLKKPTHNLGLFTNRNINLAITASFILMCTIIYVPPLQKFFAFSLLPLVELSLLMLLSVIVFFVGEGAKKFSFSGTKAQFT